MGAVVDGYRGHRIIRDFWNHYTDFPALYDRFALDSIRAADDLEQMFGFADRRVLNIACGTGKDTFHIAHRARHVIGIDMSANMLRFADERRRNDGIGNVTFVRSVSQVLPFPSAAFDCALSIHGAPFIGWGWEKLSVQEALRVVGTGGWIAFVVGAERVEVEPLLRPFGFDLRRLTVEVDYGTVDEALSTWGCIRGEEAIDYLLDRNTSRVSIDLNIWSRQR